MKPSNDIIYCMLVDFRDASIFAKDTSSKWPRDSKLKTIDGKNQNSFGYGYFDVPQGRLALNHVNNMLHVLAGGRPKPTFRKSIVQLDDRITIIARRCRIKIDSLMVNGNYIYEVLSIRKANSDCYQTCSHYITLNGEQIKIVGVLSKEKMKRFMGDEIFRDFEKMSRNFVEDYDLLTFDEIVEKLNYIYNYDKLKGEQILMFAKKCIDAKKTDIYNLLMGKRNPSGPLNFGINRRCKIYATYGTPEKITKISGTIFVPVSKDELDLFKQGCGFATLLEGGLASIEGVEQMSDNLTLGSYPPYEVLEKEIDTCTLV